MVESSAQYTTVFTNLLVSLGEENGITEVLGRPHSISAICWLLYPPIPCQELGPPLSSVVWADDTLSGVLAMTITVLSDVQFGRGILFADYFSRPSVMSIA